jgi:hypothetical protein
MWRSLFHKFVGNMSVVTVTFCTWKWLRQIMNASTLIHPKLITVTKGRFENRKEILNDNASLWRCIQKVLLNYRLRFCDISSQSCPAIFITQKVLLCFIWQFKTLGTYSDLPEFISNSRAYNFRTLNNEQILLISRKYGLTPLTS